MQARRSADPSARTEPSALSSTPARAASQALSRRPSTGRATRPRTPSSRRGEEQKRIEGDRGPDLVVVLLCSRCCSKSLEELAKFRLLSVKAPNAISICDLHVILCSKTRLSRPLTTTIEPAEAPAPDNARRTRRRRRRRRAPLPSPSCSPRPFLGRSTRVWTTKSRRSRGTAWSAWGSGSRGLTCHLLGRRRRSSKPWCCVTASTGTLGRCCMAGARELLLTGRVRWLACWIAYHCEARSERRRDLLGSLRYLEIG